MFEIVYAVLAGLIILSALAIFTLRRIAHAILALTAAFAISSFIFLYLGEVLVALLQLLIFVGGLSTYLVVAMSSEEKNMRYSRVLSFTIAALVVTAGLFVVLPTVGTPAASSNNLIAAAPAAFAGYYIILYAIALLLFSSAIGTVLFVRKFVKLLV